MIDADRLVSRRSRGFSARLRRNLSLAASAMLAPFLVINSVAADYATAGVLGGLMAVLLLSAFHLHRTGNSIFGGGLVLTLAVGAVLWTMFYHGHIGVFWAFPVVLLFHIVLDRRQALLGSLAFVALAVPVAWLALGGEVAARVLVTLTLTSWFSHIFAARYERQQRELERLVLVDPLTGCYNRRHFEHCVEEALSSKQRYSRPISLVLFDIDHFKAINDRHGHRVGDDVLRLIVNVVQHRIRTADALFRYGGDEFVVLMPETDLHHAAIVANDLRQLVAGAEVTFDSTLSLSVGVSELCRDESAESWMRRADQALYGAKRAGRDRVTISPSTVAVNQ